MATETLRPNDAGDETNLTIGGSSPAATNWESVDEVVADENVTHVASISASAWVRDLYNIDNHSVGSGTINFVKVYARCRGVTQAPNQTSLKIAIKSIATVGEGGEETMPDATTWTDFSTQWDTNPNTGLAWGSDWSVIDNLQVGVSLRRCNSGLSSGTRCTQVYVEVDYTSGTSVTIDVPLVEMSLEAISPSTLLDVTITPPIVNMGFSTFTPIIFIWEAVPCCMVKISGVEVKIVRGSLGINLKIEERSTSFFTIDDIEGTGTYIEGQPVSIWNNKGEIIFGGFIDSVQSYRVNPSGVKYHLIQCKDNHYLADKRIIVKSYSGETAGFIIDDILTDYLLDEGVTEGEIQEGPVIPEAVFNYVNCTEAFNAVAELAGFIWYVDENKKLYFIDRLTNTAPWIFTNLNSISTPTLTTGNPKYRNAQYVRGGIGTTSEQTNNFTGDGVVTAFTLGYPLAHVPTIYEDSVENTSVGIKGIDTGMDWYWNKGDATITAEVAPGDGVDIECVFYGQYPLMFKAFSPSDQIKRKGIEGGTGITEDIVYEAYHESSESSAASARAKLKQFCQDSERFSFETIDSGLKSGQILTVDYLPFGFSNHDMLIESIRINADGDYIVYAVDAITGPTMGSWGKFFSSIISRQDKSIRLGDSLFLAYLNPLESSENLPFTEDPTLYEDDFSGGIVNRWLNSAPIDVGILHNIQHERLEFSGETPSINEHDTEDYKWDDPDAIWDYATYA